MKKLAFIISGIAIIAVSCQKELKNNISNTNLAVQTRPVCGMKEAMANMPPEYREAMRTEAVTTVAPALLLYLDFDGATIRRGFPNATGMNSTILQGTGFRFCPEPSLTQEQITEIVRLVEDDYSPFNIQVTTDYSVFLNYSTPFKHLCIITTLPAVIGQPSGVGGVAPFAGPGMRLFCDPSFAFAGLFNLNEDIALVISQEVAHTLGLEHQHQYGDDCRIINEYNQGYGTGPLSFTPIMGAGYNKRITNWYGQPCEEQDDFQWLHNVVETKADDFPDEPVGHSSLVSGPVDGILEKQNDVDYILINFRSPGTVTVSSDNIDIKASLVTPGGHILAEYNDPDDINVSIPVARGMVFLKIEGASNVNMSSRFMTGQYRISF